MSRRDKNAPIVVLDSDSDIEMLPTPPQTRSSSRLATKAARIGNQQVTSSQTSPVSRRTDSSVESRPRTRNQMAPIAGSSANLSPRQPPPRRPTRQSSLPQRDQSGRFLSSSTAPQPPTSSSSLSTGRTRSQTVAMTSAVTTPVTSPRKPGSRKGYVSRSSTPVDQATSSAAGLSLGRTRNETAAIQKSPIKKPVYVKPVKKCTVKKSVQKKTQTKEMDDAKTRKPLITIGYRLPSNSNPRLRRNQNPSSSSSSSQHEDSEEGNERDAASEAPPPPAVPRRAQPVRTEERDEGNEGDVEEDDVEDVVANHSLSDDDVVEIDPPIVEQPRTSTARQQSMSTNRAAPSTSEGSTSSSWLNEDSGRRRSRHSEVYPVWNVGLKTEEEKEAKAAAELQKERERSNDRDPRTDESDDATNLSQSTQENIERIPSPQTHQQEMETSGTPMQERYDSPEHEDYDESLPNTSNFFQRHDNRRLNHPQVRERSPFQNEPIPQQVYGVRRTESELHRAPLSSYRDSDLNMQVYGFYQTLESTYMQSQVAEMRYDRFLQLDQAQHERMERIFLEECRLRREEAEVRRRQRISLDQEYFVNANVSRLRCVKREPEEEELMEEEAAAYDFKFLKKEEPESFIRAASLHRHDSGESSSSSRRHRHHDDRDRRRHHQDRSSSRSDSRRGDSRRDEESSARDDKDESRRRDNRDPSSSRRDDKRSDSRRGDSRRGDSRRGDSIRDEGRSSSRNMREEERDESRRRDNQAVDRRVMEVRHTLRSDALPVNGSSRPSGDVAVRREHLDSLHRQNNVNHLRFSVKRERDESMEAQSEPVVPPKRIQLMTPEQVNALSPGYQRIRQGKEPFYGADAQKEPETAQKAKNGWHPVSHSMRMTHLTDTNLAKLMEESKCQIKVVKVKRTLHYVDIEGSPDEIEKARQKIKECLLELEEKMKGGDDSTTYFARIPVEAKRGFKEGGKNWKRIAEDYNIRVEIVFYPQDDDSLTLLLQGKLENVLEAVKWLDSIKTVLHPMDTKFVGRFIGLNHTNIKRVQLQTRAVVSKERIDGDKTHFWIQGPQEAIDSVIREMEKAQQPHQQQLQESQKPSDEDTILVEWIQTSDAARLIGRRGETLNRIRRESRAKCWLHEKCIGGLKEFQTCGDRKAARKAMHMAFVQIRNDDKAREYL